MIKFVRRFVEVLLSNGGKPVQSIQEQEQLIAGGLTQSGKSAFKAILLVVCHNFGVGTLIVTKGNKERDSLFEKLKSYLAGTEVLAHFLLITHGRAGDGKLPEALHAGGGVVLQCTAQQMQKAHNTLLQMRGMYGTMKCVLVCDEADAFFRTEGATLKLEQALKQLSGETNTNDPRMLPCVPLAKLQISATLVPVFLMLKRKGLEVPKHNIFLTEASDDYNAMEDMEPLVDEHGSDLFLEPKELTPKNLYYSDSVDLLCEKAATKPRSLLLDISSPRVRAAHNIFEKAVHVQEKFPNICVVAICGSGIEYQFPIPVQKKHKENAGWKTAPKHVTIGELLQEIDTQIGLATPVFVFGYSRMQRGDSFRSDHRVPTHILVSLGKSQSLENLVQALGRATFNGKECLVKNGFQQVTVLMPPEDWDVAQAYPKFQREVHDRVAKGESLQSLLNGSAHLFSADADINKGRTRPIAPKKTKLTTDMEEVTFEQASPGTPGRRGDQFVQAHLEQDPLLNEVLDAITITSKEIEANTPLAHTAGAPQMAIDDLEKYVGGITMAVLKQKLAELIEIGEIRRIKDPNDGATWLYSLNRRWRRGGGGGGGGGGRSSTAAGRDGAAAASDNGARKRLAEEAFNVD